VPAQAEPARWIFLLCGLNHLVLPRGFHGRFAVSILAAALAFGFMLPAQTPKSKPASSYAASVGAPLRTIIVFGDQYNGGDELYDVKITVEEVVRGEKAWQTVRAAGDSNAAPGANLEYLLARVRFDFAARAQPHHYDYSLDPAQFSAMSADTQPYASAGLAAPVKPELRGTLRSGDSVEGWVAFLVPRGDHTPLMMFREDVGSVIHQGDASFFKLYRENTRDPTTAKSNDNGRR
jgi:hypothetical protein